MACAIAKCNEYAETGVGPVFALCSLTRAFHAHLGVSMNLVLPVLTRLEILLPAATTLPPADCGANFDNFASGKVSVPVDGVAYIDLLGFIRGDVSKQDWYARPGASRTKATGPSLWKW